MAHGEDCPAPAPPGPLALQLQRRLLALEFVLSVFSQPLNLHGAGAQHISFSTPKQCLLSCGLSFPLDSVPKGRVQVGGQFTLPF